MRYCDKRGYTLHARYLRCLLIKIALHLPSAFPLTCVRWWINKVRSIRNGRPFADYILKFVFNTIIIFVIMISVKFVSHGPINIKPVLVQIMAWQRTRDSFGDVAYLWMFKHGYRRTADNSKAYFPLQWRHIEHLGVSNHKCLYCLYKLTAKKTSNPCYWPLEKEFNGDQWIPFTKGQ